MKQVIGVLAYLLFHGLFSFASAIHILAYNENFEMDDEQWGIAMNNEFL